MLLTKKQQKQIALIERLQLICELYNETKEIRAFDDIDNTVKDLLQSVDDYKQQIECAAIIAK